MVPKLIEAQSDEHFKIASEMFRQYAAELKLDLSFQQFTKELENLRTYYSPPQGSIGLIYRDELALGCYGIRRWSSKIGELKRFYVKKEARRKGLGLILLNHTLKMAKEMGYEKVRLDTLPQMHEAIGLYRKHGFYPIPAYRYNPVPGAMYFEKNLLIPYG